VVRTLLETFLQGPALDQGRLLALLQAIKEDAGWKEENTKRAIAGPGGPPAPALPAAFSTYGRCVASGTAVRNVIDHGGSRG